MLATCPTRRGLSPGQNTHKVGTPDSGVVKFVSCVSHSITLQVVNFQVVGFSEAS